MLKKSLDLKRNDNVRQPAVSPYVLMQMHRKLIFQVTYSWLVVLIIGKAEKYHTKQIQIQFSSLQPFKIAAKFSRSRCINLSCHIQPCAAAAYLDIAGFWLWLHICKDNVLYKVITTL